MDSATLFATQCIRKINVGAFAYFPCERQESVTPNHNIRFNLNRCSQMTVDPPSLGRLPPFSGATPCLLGSIHFEGRRTVVQQVFLQ
mmetsp:Transcript_15509/g.33836  ORF Transcript_15509/g.33836 Transcript_15509/m.33836 type:complete len:87 (-) Transcript_15509:156-416(-)